MVDVDAGWGSDADAYHESMRIGVLTGGGDCPGLNAVIRAVVLGGAVLHGDEFVGILDGWNGVIEDNTVALDPDRCRAILAKGGTILGSSRTNPFATDDGADRVLATMEELGLDALVAIGGDDTLGAAERLYQRGLPVVGVPKTIDNDLAGTELTFGYDTAVARSPPRPSTGCIPPPSPTTGSWCARSWADTPAGSPSTLVWPGGGDVILIPEVPF